MPGKNKVRADVVWFVDSKTCLYLKSDIMLSTGCTTLELTHFTVHCDLLTFISVLV